MTENFTLEKFKKLFYTSDAAKILNESEREEVLNAIENEDLDFLEGIYLILENEMLVDQKITSNLEEDLTDEWNSLNSDIKDIYRVKVIQPQKEAAQKAENTDQARAKDVLRGLE